MDPLPAVFAFSVAAALVTITPGLDTALVLRTAAVEGGKPAMFTGLGVVTGVLAWGLVTALGLGAVLAVSDTAYTVLRVTGAAYLAWLGSQILRGAFQRRSKGAVDTLRGVSGLWGRGGPVSSRASRWFWRGLLNNLLNPKVGIFYLSFLPQFLPAGVNPVAFSVLLATIHAVMGLVWFGALTLATGPLARFLRRPAVTRSVDGLTGLVLLAFGIRLALERRAG